MIGHRAIHFLLLISNSDIGAMHMHRITPIIKWELMPPVWRLLKRVTGDMDDYVYNWSIFTQIDRRLAFISHTAISYWTSDVFMWGFYLRKLCETSVSYINLYCINFYCTIRYVLECMQKSRAANLQSFRALIKLLVYGNEKMTAHPLLELVLNLETRLMRSNKSSLPDLNAMKVSHYLVLAYWPYLFSWDQN